MQLTRMDGRTRRVGKSYLVAAFVPLLTLCVGCGGGGDTAHLSGTVTIDGQPLPADATGSIVFAPTEPGEAKAASVSIKDGRYDSPETPTGTVTVRFNINHPTGATYETDRGTVNEIESLVPDGYNAGITLEVDGNNSSQDFDLKTASE